MIIGIDFDGTCVTHEFPNIGKYIGAEPILKKLVNKGHKLILFTMRSNKESVNSDDYGIENKADNYLYQAVLWFQKNDIELYGVNENPTQKSWTDSPKPYCHLYIDDAALGCPLKIDFSLSERPFVDWMEIEQYFIQNNIL